MSAEHETSACTYECLRWHIQWVWDQGILYQQQNGRANRGKGCFTAFGIGMDIALRHSIKRIQLWSDVHSFRSIAVACCVNVHTLFKRIVRTNLTTTLGITDGRISFGMDI